MDRHKEIGKKELSRPRLSDNFDTSSMLMEKVYLVDWLAVVVMILMEGIGRKWRRRKNFHKKCFWQRTVSIFYHRSIEWTRKIV